MAKQDIKTMRSRICLQPTGRDPHPKHNASLSKLSIRQGKLPHNASLTEYHIAYPALQDLLRGQAILLCAKKFLLLGTNLGLY